MCPVFMTTLNRKVSYVYYRLLQEVYKSTVTLALVLNIMIRINSTSPCYMLEAQAFLPSITIHIFGPL